MAKKVLLRDWNNDEVLPITRGELVLDSSGKEAFRSNEFLATTSQPGLMSSEDKFKIDNIEGIGNIANDKVSQVNTTTSDVYRLLFSETADDETRTEGARKSAKLTFNPSTGVLQTSGLIGNIDGTYVNKLTGYSKATLISDITSEDTLVSALGKVELRAEVAYNLIQGAYDGDGTIENLAEILKVLEGISDTETIQAIVGKYLPLSGGTISGKTTISTSGWGNQLVINRSEANGAPSIAFSNVGNGIVGYLGIGGTASSIGTKPFYEDASGNSYILIHSGNYTDYAYPKDGKGYMSIAPNGRPVMVNNQGYGAKNTSGTTEEILWLGADNITYLGGTTSKKVYLYDTAPACLSGKLIHEGNIGDYNVGSATKLQDDTEYKAWGRTYFKNGVPQNVSGPLYIDTNYNHFIEADSDGLYMYNKLGGPNYIKLYNSSKIVLNGGNVLIGTAIDNGGKLQVNGDISSTNLWPIITISKSLTITSDWSDTGITFNATNFPHGNGSYMVQIDHGNCYFYTGVISVVINDGVVTANDVDEIILHGGGFDSAVQYYLRTKQDASSKTTKIQIATSGSSHTKTINFKFKRII